MKKTLLILFCVLTCFAFANAQSVSWDEAVETFLDEMEGDLDTVRDAFAEMGIEVDPSAKYDAAKKEIVLEMRFEPAIWSYFNSEAMHAAKTENLRSYQSSYKSDSDFRRFIDLMGRNNAKFRIIYSCIENGRVKIKDFTITPAEIKK